MDKCLKSAAFEVLDGQDKGIPKVFVYRILAEAANGVLNGQVSDGSLDVIVDVEAVVEPLVPQAQEERGLIFAKPATTGPCTNSFCGPYCAPH